MTQDVENEAGSSEALPSASSSSTHSAQFLRQLLLL